MTGNTTDVFYKANESKKMDKVNKEIEEWAFIIDDRVDAVNLNRTPKEQQEYDEEIKQIVASLDFSNL